MKVPRTFLDHITVTAPHLEAGAAWVTAALGVELQVGGEHPRMATHNLLLRLGDTAFLEIIAPNPSAPSPSRPRWFALDRLGPRSAPALSAWVLRSSDIHADAAAASEALGPVEPMRRGALDWLITIPEDGSVPLGGVGPALIEWQTEKHPASSLDDKGMALAKLEIFHPRPDRVERLLSSLVMEAPVSIGSSPPGTAGYLVAHILTPQGRRVLCGAPTALA